MDVFARENGLVIGDRRLAKEYSAALLAGRRLPVYRCSLPVVGEIPPELELISDLDEFLRRPGIKAAISWKQLGRSVQNQRILHLIPRDLTLGLRCKKGAGSGAVSGAGRGDLNEGGNLSGGTACELQVLI